MRIFNKIDKSGLAEYAGLLSKTVGNRDSPYTDTAASHCVIVAKSRPGGPPEVTRYFGTESLECRIYRCAIVNRGYSELTSLDIPREAKEVIDSIVLSLIKD